jgi:hypothetical protein
VYLEALGTEGQPAPVIAEALGWTRSQFDTALNVARDHLCPDLGLAIPHPVPQDGWRYRITGEWMHRDGTPAIEAGTAYAMGVIEARLRSVLRDVKVVAVTHDRRSVDGRKANFMRKHLVHIIATLDEIGPSTGDPSEDL